MNSKEFQDKIVSLSDRIYPIIIRLLGNRENAEDAVQDIMIKLWDRRKQLERHPNINGFVFLTVRNHCLDILKKQNLIQIDSATQIQSAISESIQEDIEWKETNKLITEMLQKLPELQRNVVIMRDIDGYEFEEIAVVMKLKVEYLRVLLSRARKQIGTELNKFYCYEQRESR